ncbi:MAG TPA: hypothetical protein V6D27_11190 [Vampirovibrionales bacterium]
MMVIDLKNSCGLSLQMLPLPQLSPVPKDSARSPLTVRSRLIRLLLITLYFSTP